jgi:type II secretory pathway predicted ATPase ExeA
MKDLLSWFGFKQFPFDKEIKPRDVIQTTPVKESLARLDYIKRRGGIMLITGDPGVGKTLALRVFTDSLNENLYKVLYTPLSTLNRSDILRHINALLGLPGRFSKCASYQQIQKELLEFKEQRGKTIVLILDEAHLLQTGTLEEIRLLTNFKMDSYDPFILILSGQSEFRRIMEYAVMAPLNQRVKIRYHLSGLSLEETINYIRKRLEWAGCNEPIFSDDAYSAIHEIAYGIPRLIGNLGEESLTYAMFANKKAVDADMVLKIKATGSPNQN